MKASKYLLMLSLIACRPDRPEQPKPKLTDVRWYLASNRNYFFAIKEYDPCNPLYGSCRQLYWLDANDNKFISYIHKDTIFRDSPPMSVDTLIVKKLTTDSLVLRMNGFDSKFTR